MTEYQPRYRWRPDSPDTPNDFLGHENGRVFGRIRLMNGGPSDGQWWWILNHQDLRLEFNTGNAGLAENAREASRYVEEMYDRAKAEDWFLPKPLRAPSWYR